MNDYLDRLGLLCLDLDEIDADRLLRLTYSTGHDRRPIVESERLEELLEILHGEGGNQ